ncbi:MAG: glycoside hydrolase family 5 protein, partial [Symploca sp. SIO1C4]|nr:glycoside hydrolase family 5 protein [Symploca sp. SIO1C4]
KNYALIVGEYGVENADRDTSAATRAMFNTAVDREIGRVVWSWWGGDDNDLTTSNNGGGQHINNPDNPTNLSWLGQQVWKDNHRREDLDTL